MTRKPPLVRTVGDDPLVRVEDEAEARAAALAFLADGDQAEDHLEDCLADGYEIVVRRVGPFQAYRWVPAPPGDGEWRYYLHPAEPGPGAFRARVVEWGFARPVSTT